MTKIEWELDRSGPIDLVDPLGTIKIIDNQGDVVQEEATYLDSWFDALIQGVNQLGSGNTAEIDLYVESNRIIFNRSDDVITLSYGTSQVHFELLTDFCTILQGAASAFLDELRLSGNVNEQENLKAIIDWLGK